MGRPLHAMAFGKGPTPARPPSQTSLLGRCRRTHRRRSNRLGSRRRRSCRASGRQAISALRERFARCSHRGRCPRRTACPHCRHVRSAKPMPQEPFACLRPVPQATPKGSLTGLTGSREPTLRTEQLRNTLPDARKAAPEGTAFQSLPVRSGYASLRVLTGPRAGRGPRWPRSGRG